MRDRGLYAGVALLALAAGATFWALDRVPRKPEPAAVTIGPAALYAATFVDEQGRAFPLGRYQGRAMLINFWATWCAPCREEMPTLSAAADQWGDRVAILGLSAEPAATVDAFRRSAKISYLLATGGRTVDELGIRLGNTAGVLPYSVVVASDGRVVSQKVGPYSPSELERALTQAARKTP
jgi:thiol-disulfide isomerase/thioredoxin